MLFHQKHWEGYVVSHEPFTIIDVCSKCGESHVNRRGFTTEADAKRRKERVLNMNFKV